MNLSRFGNANIPFKLSDKEPRADVLKWKISRSNASCQPSKIGF